MAPLSYDFTNKAMEGNKALKREFPPSSSCGHFLIRTITIASSVADVFSAQSPWTISFVWGKRIDASTCEKESDTNYKKPSRQQYKIFITCNTSLGQKYMAIRILFHRIEHIAYLIIGFLEIFCQLPSLVFQFRASLLIHHSIPTSHSFHLRKEKAENCCESKDHD